MIARVVHADEVEVEDVLAYLLEHARSELGDVEPQALVVLAGIDVDHPKLINGLHEAWPNAHLVGCTTDGEFSTHEGFTEDSVAVVFLAADDVNIRSGVGRNVSKDVTEACRQAYGMACGDDAASLCLTFPESLTVNGDSIVANLQAQLGPDVPLIGGIAADQWRFKSTYQFYGGEVLTDSVPILVFSGSVACSVGVASGWKPIGRPGEVTLAEGNVIREVDHEPAINFYRKFLGQDAKPTGEFPVAVLNADGQAEYLRSPLDGYDAETGALSFYAGIPSGATIQIAVADRDAILSGCKFAIHDAFERFPEGKKPSLAFCVSCAARKLLLGTRTSEEKRIVDEHMERNSSADAIAVLGFYAYGEIAPSRQTGQSRFHNQTFVALLIGDGQQNVATMEASM